MHLDPEMLPQTVAGGSSRIRAYVFHRIGNAKCLSVGLPRCTCHNKFSKCPSWAWTHASAEPSERRWDVHTDFGANLVSCILYALPNMLPGVITVGSFYGTPASDSLCD